MANLNEWLRLSPRERRLPGQTEFAGTGAMEKARARGRLMRLAAAPLKPRRPQAPCDVGLFSDDAKQIDLMDLVRT